MPGKQPHLRDGKETALTRCLLSLLAMGPLLSPAAVAAPPASNPMLEQVKRQFREFHLKYDPVDPGQAMEFAGSLREDGSWPDIDYKSKDRSGWPPKGHLNRLLIMTRSLASDGPDAANRKLLADSINRGLAFWRQHDFICPNWWHNRIGAPTSLGEIALLLGNRLQPEDFEYITRTTAARSKIGNSTAQNRVWLAGCTLTNGLLQNDEEQVARAAATIFAESAISPGKEGIQSDFSFHQHGSQLQFGNYGLSLAGDEIRWMAILRGTPWAMSSAQMDTLRGYLLNGENWIVWRGAMDISCCGRAFAPGVCASKGDRLAQLMRTMADLDAAHSDAYLAFLKRNAPDGKNDLIGCRYFWKSCYLVSRHKDWAFSVKMSCRRVKGSESLNGQNLSGYYLGDGATYLYHTGSEYTDIFPLWDWWMLPGVTCPQNQGPLPRFGSYHLETDFAGGVTDGRSGCAALDYVRDGLKVKKAWFVGPDQLVCLGSGVTADAAVTAPVVTTLNQCLRHGSVRIFDGKRETTLENGTHSYGDLQWVEHDGFRYTLAGGQNVTLGCERRTDSWEKVLKTANTPEGRATGEIFSLAIHHGIAPADGSYAYCVSPAAAGPPDFRTLSNTAALQAVSFGSRLVEAVFHTPGKLDYSPGHSVAAGSPCLLMIDLTGENPVVTVADPAQRLSSLNLEIDGKKRTVQLPMGQEAGKSVVVR